MQVNSEGIHGTKAIAPYKEDRIAFTSKDNNVYAFYLNAKDEYMPSVVKIRSFVPVSAKSVFLMGHNRPPQMEKNWRRNRNNHTGVCQKESSLRFGLGG